MKLSIITKLSWIIHVIIAVMDVLIDIFEGENRIQLSFSFIGVKTNTGRDELHKMPHESSIENKGSIKYLP